MLKWQVWRPFQYILPIKWKVTFGMTCKNGLRETKVNGYIYKSKLRKSIYWLDNFGHLTTILCIISFSFPLFFLIFNKEGKVQKVYHNVHYLSQIHHTKALLDLEEPHSWMNTVQMWWELTKTKTEVKTNWVLDLTMHFDEV